ncbi:MAG: signal peptidase I [Coriobacteriia bacterium]|nr:signal peptidase I [Coriobacteriia bacterium]
MATSAFGDSTGLITGLFSGTFGLIYAAWAVLYLVGLWKIFAKAGEPGWAAIVPIYNIFVLLKIVGRPWWWLLLMLIPFVNFVIAIMITWNLAKVFGHGFGYFLGLLFLGGIFYPMLGFGGSRYLGPAV